MHEPTQLSRELYAKLMKLTISRDGSLRKELIAAFKTSNKCIASTIKANKIVNVSYIAVRKVLGKVLKQRKLCVVQFLMSFRKVNDHQFTADDFGQCFYTALSELFFYEESYYHHKDQCSSNVDVPVLFKKQVHAIRCDSCVPKSDRKHMITHLEKQIGDMNCCHCMKHTTPIVIDEKGRCKIAEEIGERNAKSNRPSKWKCTSHCKLPTTE